MTIDALVSGDDDDLGIALPRRLRGMMMRRAPRRRLPAGVAPMPRALQEPDGGVTMQPGIYTVAFPTFTFNLASGLTTITQQANPQVNFRCQRLSVLVTRSGASATASAPLLTQGSVGIKPVVLSPDPVPVETFLNTAVDVNVLWPQTRPGQLYSLSIKPSAAITGTDVMACFITMIGTAYQ